MKKSIVFVLFLLASNFTCVGQWIKILGTEYKSAVPNHSMECYDDGYLLSYEYNEYYGSVQGAGLIKTNRNGDILWKQHLGNSSQYVQIRGFLQDNSGNTIITGALIYDDQVRDPFILKLNTCMQVDWCKIFRSEGLDDLANQVVYLPSSNSYVVDFMYDRAQDRVKLINIDSTGTVIWENYFCNSSNYSGTLAEGIVSTPSDSSIILYGFTYMKNDSLYTLQPYWLNVSSEGSFVWENYGIPDTSFLRGFARRKPLFVTSGKFITPLVRTRGKFSALTCHSLINCEYSWIKSLHQPDSSVNSVVNSAALLDNEIYTGMQYFTTGFDGIGNASLQKSDTAGNFLSEVIIPENFTNVISDITVTSNNKLLLFCTHAGDGKMDMMLLKYNQDLEFDSIYTTPFVCDSLCSGSINSGTIDLACEIVTRITYQQGLPETFLSLAPNPAQEFTIIHLPETIETGKTQGKMQMTTFRSDYVKNLVVEVFNLNGQKVYSDNWPDNTKEYVLWVNRLQHGLYLIKVSNGMEINLTGKLLVN